MKKILFFLLVFVCAFFDATAQIQLQGTNANDYPIITPNDTLFFITPSFKPNGQNKRAWRKFSVAQLRDYAFNGVATQSALNDTATALRGLIDKAQMQNVAFVSPNGDDATAQKGNINKTYATLTAAKSSGASQIHVFGGTYNITTNSANDGLSGNVYYHFHNATINHTGIFALFYDSTGFSTTVRGNLKINATSVSVFRLVHENSEMDFEGMSITQNQTDAPIVTQNSNSVFRKLKIVCDELKCPNGNSVVLGGHGGSRNGKTRGFLYVQAKVWTSNWWEYLTGYKNYDVYMVAQEKNANNADGGAIDIGYGMDSCEVHVNIETYKSNRFGVLIGGNISNTKSFVKITNGEIKGNFYGAFTVATGNAANVNNLFVLHNSRLQLLGDSHSFGCIHILNGVAQDSTYKIVVKDTELITTTTDATKDVFPILSYNNAHLSLQNVFMRSNNGKPSMRSRLNTLSVYSRNNTANTTVDTASGVSVIGAPIGVYSDLKY